MVEHNGSDKFNDSRLCLYQKSNMTLSVMATALLTSHAINERPVGAVHLVDQNEAERDDRSQKERFLSFNGTKKREAEGKFRIFCLLLSLSFITKCTQDRRTAGHYWTATSWSQRVQHVRIFCHISDQRVSQSAPISLISLMRFSSIIM